MSVLPHKNVIIMGDFNINLFDSSSSTFESSLYGNNMIPIISLATHEKPGCNPTLIDNIMINSTENLVASGTLESGVSHHLPIFIFLDCNTPSTDSKSSNTHKYDYCETNINKFIEEIENIKTQSIEYTEENYNIFIEFIKEKIDNVFKVDEGTFKKSCRNMLIKPWITPGIVASINKKHLYYKLWKKSVNKKSKTGNNELYGIYSNFRKKTEGYFELR